ncbi:MAG: hypothetical protein UIG41_08200, partial [Gemmiger formicilis]|nr:hypothetical protein [Gemmiger formicilis]
MESAPTDFVFALGGKNSTIFIIFYLFFIIKKSTRVSATRVLFIYLLLPNIHIHRLRDPLDAAGACVLPY